MQVLVISLLYIIRYIESSSPTKIIHQQYQPCTILARKKGMANQHTDSPISSGNSPTIDTSTVIILSRMGPSLLLQHSFFRVRVVLYIKNLMTLR